MFIAKHAKYVAANTNSSLLKKGIANDLKSKQVF